MNFASSTVQLVRNGDVAIASWRQDCGAGDVITASLSYTVGIISYRWRLIGRPEGSGSGGVGPEPLYLGSSASAAFTVDIPGTYIVECLVNGGSPDATIIVGGVAYPETFTNPLGLLLRLLGPGETDQDNADPQVAQGWIKMLNRWLKVLRAFVSQAALFLSNRIPLPDGAGASGTGNEATRWDHVHPLKPVPVLTTRYYLTSNPSDTSGDYLFSTIQPAPADLQAPSGSTYPIIQDSPVGDPNLTTWPAGVVMAHIVARVVNAHAGMFYPMSFGTGDSQAAILARNDGSGGGGGGVTYQIAPWPAQPLLTADYQTFVVPLYVQSLDGSASDRLRAWFRCNPTGGAITDEQFEIHLGDSYLDTLFPPSDGGTGGDTYKVKRDVDATPVYGDQLLVSPNGSISQVNDPESDSIDTQVVCGSDLPLPDGPVASAGDPNDRPASIKHVHPLVPPSTNAGKLWTAFAEDVRQLAAVDAIYGGDIPADFTEVATGVWRRNVPGVPLAFDGVTPWLNMRVLDAVDGSAAGIYDLTDTGQSVTAYNTPYYIQADGSLGLTPPTTSGILTATIVDRNAYISTVTPVGMPDLQVWPGRVLGVGNYPVPVTIRCRMIGAVLPDQVYTLAIKLYRRTTGGALTSYGYIGEGEGESIVIPSDGSWATLAVAIQVNQLPTGSTSDVLESLFSATLLSGTAENGATFEIAYGGTSPQITSQFTVTSEHFAVLERSSDARATGQFSDGMYVYVNGGSVHHGQTWQATLPSPFELDVSSQSWASVTPPTPAPPQELLTASQLPLAAAGDNQATAFASRDTHEVELQIFTEHDTALGGQTLSADDPIRFHVPVSLWVNDQYADTFVYCYLRAHAPAGNEAWVPVATTQALHNTELGVFVAVGTMGSAYPIPVGSSLQARYTVESSSVDGINIDFLYNDPTHKSYIEIPLIFGYAGTSRHPELSERNALDQHDADSGSITPSDPKAITTVDGFLTLPSQYMTVVKLMGTEPLLGISTRSDRCESIPLILFILQAATTDPNNSARDPFRVITNGADMTGHDGFSHIDLGMMGMGKAAVDNQPPNYELPMYSCLQLICMGGTWRPVAPAFVYQSP